MQKIIKQIRKTSLVLFGHKYHETRKRSISESYAEHPFPGEFESITLHEEIQQLKETIKSRDDEINKLRSEIHKLKVKMIHIMTNLLRLFKKDVLNLLFSFILFFSWGWNVRGVTKDYCQPTKLCHLKSFEKDILKL